MRYVPGGDVRSLVRKAGELSPGRVAAANGGIGYAMGQFGSAVHPLQLATGAHSKPIRMDGDLLQIIVVDK